MSHGLFMDKKDFFFLWYYQDILHTRCYSHPQGAEDHAIYILIPNI